MRPLEKALDAAKAKRRLPPPAKAKQIRQDAGLSQEVIADEVGVTRTCIVYWENGSRRPRQRHLLRYLAVLDRLAEEIQSPGGAR